MRPLLPLAREGFLSSVLIKKKWEAECDPVVYSDSNDLPLKHAVFFCVS